jgi:four helix bundle protein
VGDFRKLEVWQKAQDLVTCIYRVTTGFPTGERYGLSSQMRRAAVSVSANLAEGCGRMGDAELRRFIRISMGSLAELECELLIAKNLRFVNPDVSHELSLKIGSIRGMLQRLHRTLPRFGSPRL